MVLEGRNSNSSTCSHFIITHITSQSITWIPEFVMATVGCGISHKDT